ncbi:hypothetical protein HFK87_23080 [Ralstonia pseudosolanacearum]|uniref:hypothetical protein n=1 Tax=Ralstonia pseudosolanacearum TaxID=1310165 RepID=UPI002002C966|nr:hypothetical protein [Ralstonia pseudosolanacearum]MCK4130353.1 hypothetical protein [Ralstonia pseudosolanacearum]
MSFVDEFAVVDLVLGSQLPTRSVDAFALSVVKMERQLRRLFTYLVFQSPAFTPEHVGELRAVLGASRRAYFDGFERGFNALYRRPIEQLVGNEYALLGPVLEDAIAVRNKIFHGQLTDRCLQQEQLGELIDRIRRWCYLLARGATLELGYDGFERGSFRKGAAALNAVLRVQIGSTAEYRDFLRLHVERVR